MALKLNYLLKVKNEEQLLKLLLDIKINGNLGAKERGISVCSEKRHAFIFFDKALK